MRKVRVKVATVVGALGASALSVAVGAPVLGAAPAGATSSVAPLNLAYVESLAGSAQTPTVTQTSTGLQATYNATSHELDVSWGAGTSDSGSLTVSAVGPIGAGGLYQPSDAAGVSLGTNGVDCSSQVASADVEIDQMTLAPSGAVQSLGIQFDCTADDASVGVAGTFAYNLVPSTPGQGYYLYGDDGSLAGFGNDDYLDYLGDLSTVPLNKPIVGMAATADHAGYWMVATDGGLFAFGDAGFYGSMGGAHLNEPIVAMAATADGKGYWEVASDGGIFAFGDAAFDGSMGGFHLNQPIVGMAAVPGQGYLEVASDGGIFAFGGARFYGSMGGTHLNQPIISLAATPDGRGYWMVASDGGIFSFGDASFHGSLGQTDTTGVAGMLPG